MDLRDVKAPMARGEGQRVEFKEAARFDFGGERAIVTFARVPTLQPAELTAESQLAPSSKKQTKPLAKRTAGKDG